MTSIAPARPGAGQRLAALAALVIAAAVLLTAAGIAISQFPRGLVVLALIVAALAAAGFGLLRTGILRLLGAGLAVAAVAAAVVLLLTRGENLLEGVLIVAGLALTVLTAKFAFRAKVELPTATPPRRAVLFYNPKSGGGKAEKFRLADEARARGIEPVELTFEVDLEVMVRNAVDAGADALAMAGGDGSQAVVAKVAAELDLPYACIPAGTRNHFALDLGVDRDDVVGALDAFVAGAGERRVDLAEVNGQVFVNNVSLGLYAEAVQREGYREAKMRTILATVPDLLGPDGEGLDLRWTGPGGRRHSSGAAILVSNNRYRLGRAVGSGTRPRIDDGLLGITVAGAPVGGQGRLPVPQRPWREWSTPEFQVDADGPIAAGIDGEAVTLEAPLDFRIRPGVLRVRIAAEHPGASPAAAIPERALDTVKALAAIAAGHRPNFKHETKDI